MPISKDHLIEVIDTILEKHSSEYFEESLRPKDPNVYPLPRHLPRQLELSKEVALERIAILGEGGASLDFVSGTKVIDDPAILQGNIENFIGFAQMPIGIAGPLRINGLYAQGDFYVPLATTEGALVGSYNRGAKIISLSGGATVMCLNESISRAPGFAFSTMVQASKFIMWCASQFETLKEVAQTTTSHGKLENINTTLTGNQVFMNLEYTTGDASGQNMVTIATDVVCKYIMEHCPVKPLYYFVESNMSGDKKATALSYLSVRGKKVSAEVVIPKEIFKKFLRTTPKEVMNYWKMSVIAGVQTGSMGVQGHYANGLAALFIACGQDAACVAEAAVGITRVDLTDSGDLYISVTLPNLIVGTVGGGTHLPTQSECLSLLGCKGNGVAKKFAEICAATVLAGEISIMGALAGNHFASAHQQYGRKK